VSAPREALISGACGLTLDDVAEAENPAGHRSLEDAKLLCQEQKEVWREVMKGRRSEDSEDQTAQP
jgi:hypothetical protein